MIGSKKCTLKLAQYTFFTKPDYLSVHDPKATQSRLKMHSDTIGLNKIQHFQFGQERSRYSEPSNETFGKLWLEV